MNHGSHDQKEIIEDYRLLLASMALRRNAELSGYKDAALANQTQAWYLDFGHWWDSESKHA